jgi:hypothetical protein
MPGRWSRSFSGGLLAAIAAAAVSGSVQASDEPARDAWTVEQVVASLKEGREPWVSFEETTYSSLLTKPLVLRGVLRFTPPSRLEKEVREPYRERYVIEGDRVTFESERKRERQTISLEDYPALRSFVEAFLACFTGDVVKLNRTYETRLEGDRRKWTLLLRPRDHAGRSMVESIEFAGSDGRIATVTIRAPDGDRSLMTLSRGHSP